MEHAVLQAAQEYSVNDSQRLQLLYALALQQASLEQGDMLELGVYRGGSALLLAHALALRKAETAYVDAMKKARENK